MSENRFCNPRGWNIYDFEAFAAYPKTPFCSFWHPGELFKFWKKKWTTQLLEIIDGPHKSMKNPRVGTDPNQIPQINKANLTF